MDRMYRYTRHVYDLSRKYYLFGRDRLLRKMQIAEGDRVIEVGCGTAICNNMELWVCNYSPAGNVRGMYRAQVAPQGCTP